MIYNEIKRNHVIIHGRDNALNEFLNSTYNGMSHKLKNSVNSHSEDALTWSCFDCIRQKSRQIKEEAEKSSLIGRSVDCCRLADELDIKDEYKDVIKDMKKRLNIKRR